MGPSGSGKTTLLNLLGGLDVPTRGTITVAGDAVKYFRKQRGKLDRGPVYLRIASALPRFQPVRPLAPRQHGPP